MVAQACPLFVPLVEEGLEDRFDYRGDRAPISGADDRRRFGHGYSWMHALSLIAHVIQRVLGENVKLVSSADEAAKEIKDTLAAMNHLSCSRRVKDLFYASDDIAGFQRLYDRIFGNREATFIEAASDFLESFRNYTDLEAIVRGSILLV